jgi:hypothetical protein
VSWLACQQQLLLLLLLGADMLAVCLLIRMDANAPRFA